MGASLNWFCNFLVGYFFPSMQTALGPCVALARVQHGGHARLSVASPPLPLRLRRSFSFLPFSFVLLCCFLVTSKWFVETKGRSVDEVQSLYQGNNKVRSGGGA